MATFYYFDATEFISFIVVIICLAIISYKHFSRPKKLRTSLGKTSVLLMFLIFLFIASNRFFTNIEAVAYKALFNLIEHLSSLAAGLAALVFSWKGVRGDKNRK